MIQCHDTGFVMIIQKRKKAKGQEELEISIVLREGGRDV